MIEDKIISEFYRIKELGFIKSNRKNNTGIGKTFEDYLGVIENNKKDPDFEVFEVKSHRQLASSKITLTTNKPTFPKKANNFLRLTYGKPDKKFPEILVLHSSMFGDRFNTYNNTYGFKLEIDRIAKRINIVIKELSTNMIISQDVYYSFEDIIYATKKLSNLFVVYANYRHTDEYEEFHYFKSEVYLGFNIEKFFNILESGYIQYDIRIGVYKSGKMIGKPHDHGSGFRVDRTKLKDLYDSILEII